MTLIIKLCRRGFLRVTQADLGRIRSTAMHRLELHQQVLTYQQALRIREPLPGRHSRAVLPVLHLDRPLNLTFCPLALIELLGVLTR